MLHEPIEPTIPLLMLTFFNDKSLSVVSLFHIILYEHPSSKWLCCIKSFNTEVSPALALNELSEQSFPNELEEQLFPNELLEQLFPNELEELPSPKELLLQICPKQLL